MNDTSVDGNNKKNLKKNNMSGISALTMWCIILAIYIVLLCAIGYIAFWEQDFNKPQNTVGSYINILSEYKRQEAKNGSGSESTEDINEIIKEMMKKDADNAGDLQELASQSFNIIMGTLLAFLSSSATMVIQRSQKN
ncbi:MAG: hypothetical protein HRT37_04390 [Alteromonadaceae bacterium]|nr:hypothetical protein [Alteromonadaceae bacterium]